MIGESVLVSVSYVMTRDSVGAIALFDSRWVVGLSGFSSCGE